MSLSRPYRQFEAIGQFPNSLGDVRGTLCIYKLNGRIYALSRQKNGTFRAFGKETVIAALALANSVAGFFQLAPNTPVGDLDSLATDAQCVSAGFAVLTDVPAVTFPVTTDYIEGDPILKSKLTLWLIAREQMASKALKENGISVTLPAYE